MDQIGINSYYNGQHGLVVTNPRVYQALFVFSSRSHTFRSDKVVLFDSTKLIETNVRPFGNPRVLLFQSALLVLKSLSSSSCQE